MSAAIVVMTHKRAARAMIESAEMICGVQDNVIAVDFLEDEDIKGLVEKCKKELNGLHTEDGILYLVDLFGGTPFNAAYLIAKDDPKQAVIAGVNLPMLMEAVLSRENTEFQALCMAVQESATEGIRMAEKTAAERSRMAQETGSRGEEDE